MISTTKIPHLIIIPIHIRIINLELRPYKPTAVQRPVTPRRLNSPHTLQTHAPRALDFRQRPPINGPVTLRTGIRVRRGGDIGLGFRVQHIAAREIPRGEAGGVDVEDADGGKARCLDLLDGAVDGIVSHVVEVGLAGADGEVGKDRLDVEEGGGAAEIGGDAAGVGGNAGVVLGAAA